MPLRESVPCGRKGSVEETALLARRVGKEWSGLTSRLHSKDMLSLAISSVVMVCIPVPGSVQKPQGIERNKK